MIFKAALLTLCSECAGYLALGLVLAIHGPTLLDLAHQTGALCFLASAAWLTCPSGSTIEEIGRIFTARSFGEY
jgi:hypothetical protein